jgi:hypothetical protein
MFAVIATGAALGAAAVGLLGAVLAKVWDGIKFIFGLTKDDRAAMGRELVEGIANGIKAAGSLVWEALKGVVMGGVHKVEKLLLIGSPSRYMHDKIGFQMGAGTAGGMEDSAPDVAGSATKMVTAGTDAAQRAVTASPRSSGGGGRTLNFTNCTFGEGTSEGLIRKWIHSALDEDGLTAEVA